MCHRQSRHHYLFAEDAFFVCTKVQAIKVGAEEPSWVVNFKKSIASHMQLDMTGVKADGAPLPPVAGELNNLISTFEVFFIFLSCCIVICRDD